MTKRELLEALLIAVKAMRAAQRGYFKTRSLVHLQRSQELERRVDELIEKIFSKQGELL